MSAHPGVAIVGMACLFPGAPDLDAYWRNILGKVDAVSDPPPESWDPDVYYDPAFADPDATYCKRGGYLGSLASFDPLAHGIPPVAVGGEPDQWLALQVAADALADAGATDLPEAVRARTEIVLGKGTYLNGGNAIAVQRGLVVGQTIELLRRLHPEHTEAELAAIRAELQAQLPSLGADTVPGLIPNIIVGRIANRLDLMGPAYTVDAACASSLIALEHAVRDLNDGSCDLAIAGGSQVWMPVATLNLFCRLGALSRDERITPFAKGSRGTLLGEGIGMVVLKRAEDAARDGDRVYAVVRGVGVASDGKATGVMAPRVEGEELALRRAYAAAGVSPESVGLIEAHGTGTPVGDATEIEALTRVFGARQGEAPRVAIGTVKSMISHTIPAAGVAGVIKAALSLHHRVLPPTLHCDEPDPALGLDASPFYVNTATRPWIHGADTPRRAGVNAFGFGGINAHALLEAGGDGVNADHRPPWDTELFAFEAPTAAALADAAEALLVALTGHEPDLADLAHTLRLAVGGDAQALRLAIVAGSHEDLRGKLAQAVEKLRASDTRRIRNVRGIYFAAEPIGREGKVALVFPGEGAQYPDMLADLCLHFDEARAVFDRIDRLYAGHPRGDLLSDWVFPSPSATPAERAHAQERLMQLDIAVESVLTANGAMHAVLDRLLPHVDAVVGHSTGEHSAALATGVLDLDEDARLQAFSQGLYRAYAEASERHDLPQAVLLALGAGGDEALRLAREAGGEADLAMDNCPHQAVLVCAADTAVRVRELAARDGLVCETLPYDRAVHTPRFAPFAEALRPVFADLPIGAATTALWSCTTAAPYPADPDAVRALLVEHWTSPVRFRETIEALYEDGVRVFVESGPRGNMTAFVEDVLRGRPHLSVAADQARRTGTTQLNHLVAQLLVHGVDVDLGHLSSQRDLHEVDWRSPTPPAAPRLRVPLSTRWPMLELDDAMLDRIAAAAPEPPAPAPATAALAPHGPAPAHVPPVPAATASTPAAATPAAPALIPAAAAPVPTAAAAHLDEHLERMAHFLDTTEAVMHAYLGQAVAQDRHPLLGTVVESTPGVELTAQRVVDPQTDPALIDHALGRVVSRHDPALTGLPVMALTLSLEVLAEAADALVPDRIVTGLRDVRAHRWLAFPDGPQTLEVHARRLASGDVRATLRSLQETGAGGPAVEATVVLGDAYPPAPPVAPPDLDGARPGPWRGHEHYGDVLFHGPTWRAVEQVDAIAPGGASARLRTLPADPRLVLDPVVLDAAGQVVGLWAAQELDAGRVVFPFRLSSLDLHGPRRPAGEALDCHVVVDRLGDELLRSDLDVLGADGRPWMRLRGWEDKRFHVPARFAPLTLPGELPPLSAPWPAAPRGVAAGAVRHLDGTLPADAGLWEPAWAARVLARGERDRFAALERPPARRLEWLAARTAAKEAVVGLLWEHHRIDVLPADVDLVPDELGCPRVVMAGLEHLDVVPVVSLAHSGGLAAAAAALVPRGAPDGVGIDLERLRPLPDGFAATALTAAERALLPADPAPELLLRCWCAKEAAAKATGRGLLPGPASAALVAAHEDGETFVIDVAGRPLVARTAIDAGCVVATVWPQDHPRPQEPA